MPGRAGRGGGSIKHNINRADRRALRSTELGRLALASIVSESDPWVRDLLLVPHAISRRDSICLTSCICTIFVPFVRTVTATVYMWRRGHHATHEATGDLRPATTRHSIPLLYCNCWPLPTYTVLARLRYVTGRYRYRPTNLTHGDIFRSFFLLQILSITLIEPNYGIGIFINILRVVTERLRAR